MESYNRNLQPRILPTGVQMPSRFPNSILAAAFAFSWLAWTPAAAWPQATHADSQPRPQNSGQTYQWPPPSQDEIRARTKNLIANQHADDLAEDRFERIERHVEHSGGPNSRVLDDKTIRFVPNGAGTTKLLLSENGKPVDPAESRRELENLLQVLQMMLNPNDPRMKTASAKYEKRMHDSAELVDSVTDAFTIAWQGEESRNGRDCDVIQASPSPTFHPHSIRQDLLTHVSAKVWLDHSTDQVVHIDAQVLSDIPFGGGVLYKLYRGGTFTLDQAEVAPGVWLPAHEQYDFSGRKFFFPFEEHESIDFTHYRFVGHPKEALALIQGELADGKPAAGDP
jgi:hypothetical protein